MRDPNHPAWPDGGERTELREVADRWKWRYVDWALGSHKRRVLGVPADTRLGDAVNAYLAHRKPRVAAQTWINDRTALRHLLVDFEPDTRLYSVNPQATIDRLLESGYAVRSVTTYSRFLSSFFHHVGLAYKVVMPKLPKANPRVWSDAEIDCIRERAEHTKLDLAVDVGLFMGLRVGEIWGLNWADIDEPRRVVRVVRQYPDRPLKSGLSRTAVVLPGWDHAAEGGVGRVVTVPQRVQRNLRDVIGDLYEPGVGWHSLRHTYARMFLERSPDMRLLQASLGHSSVIVTEANYNWLLPDRAADIAKQNIYRHNI